MTKPHQSGNHQGGVQSAVVKVMRVNVQLAISTEGNGMPASLSACTRKKGFAPKEKRFAEHDNMQTPGSNSDRAKENILKTAE